MTSLTELTEDSDSEEKPKKKKKKDSPTLREGCRCHHSTAMRIGTEVDAVRVADRVLTSELGSESKTPGDLEINDLDLI